MMTLADYQRENIRKIVASWAETRKIADYQSYLRVMDKWLSVITDGRPLAVVQETIAGSRTEIDELIDFLTAAYTDILSQESVLNDMLLDLMKTKQNVLSTAKMWQRRVDNIRLLVDKIEEENRNKPSNVAIQTFTTDAKGIYEGLQVNRRTGELEVKPGKIIPVETSPEKVTVSVFPESGPGFWHDFTNKAVTDMSMTAYADITPIVLYNGVQYSGAVSEITLKYYSAISFNRIEIIPQADLKLELIDVRVRYFNALFDNQDNWISIFDATDITTNKVDQIVFKDTSINTVTDVRLVFLQRSGYVDNHKEWKAPVSYQLSAIEGVQVRGKKRSEIVFDFSLYSISFSTYSYGIPSTGRYYSHERDDGYYLDTKPVGSVKLKAIQTLSAVSSIMYNLEDSLTDRIIPLLPEGMTVFREPVSYSTSFNEIKLTFPMKAGTFPTLYLNGAAMSLTSVVHYNIIMSRRIYMKDWYPAQRDRVLIEYAPAVDHSVVIYMVTPFDNTIPALDQGAGTTVFASWNAAFTYAAALSNVQIVPVLARLDEYDYWFFGGAQDSNLNRTLITVPPL